MDLNQINQLLIMHGDKLPAVNVEMIKMQLLNKTDYPSVSMAFSQLKDPTVALILSILTGGWGVDRFYIGDIGLGVGKLLTGGGCGVWWIIDMILIMDATKKKNLEQLNSMLSLIQ
jgi:TM2 domain-containing membrane protein YozV